MHFTVLIKLNFVNLIVEMVHVTVSPSIVINWFMVKVNLVFMAMFIMVKVVKLKEVIIHLV